MATDVPFERLRRVLAGDDFGTLMLGYVQAQLLQSMQSPGCNAKHTVEQRLARLLSCSDRTNPNSFVLPHVFLQTCSGATVVANVLRQTGLIRYSQDNM